MQKFSDPFVRNAKEGYHWDNSLKGFGLRVGKNTRVFVFLRSSGQRENIGRHPALSLAEARQEAHRRIARRTLGFVPSKPTLTLTDAIAAFLDAATVSKRPRTVQDYRYHLHRHWEPVFGNRRLSEITKGDITLQLTKLYDRPGEAEHALVYLKGFYSWSLKAGLTDVNPCSHMPSIAPQTSRDRVLSDDEIRATWKVTEEPTQYNVSTRLLLLTGQRGGEIAALRKAWIGDGMITLPKEICKNGREHIFPTGGLAATLLGSAAKVTAGDILFPARGNSKSCFNGWSKSKAQIDKLSGVKAWTLHDLRRTFATKLASLGVAQPVTEKLLNHVSGLHSGVSGIYNRHSYWEEMKAAIAAYEAHLTQLLNS